MKCLSCNNEIPDSSVVCPFCSRKVEPASQPIPIYNVSNTSVLPTTPSTPVLPQDQHLEATLNMNAVSDASVSQVVTQAGMNQIATPSATGQALPTNQTSPIPAPVNQMPVNSNLGNQSAINPTPTSSNIVSPSQVNSVNVQNSVNTQMVNNNGTSVSSTVPLQNEINPEFITPSGESVDSVKLGNTLPLKKKKSKVKMIIIIVLIILILGGGGAFGYFYYTQYKTSEKRIDAIVNALSSPIRRLKNETIDKNSGNYTVNLNVSYGDKQIDSKFKGTFATDLKAEALDFTLDLESLVATDEMLNNPLNLELYYNDSRIYLLLQNFYDNYIYDEFDEYHDKFMLIKNNEINYLTMINAIKAAIGSGIKTMNKTQKVGNVTVKGVQSKANIISIKLSDANINIFRRSFYRSLANNSKFITEYSKIYGKDEEITKEYILKKVDEKKEYNLNGNLEFYTAMFGEQLIGIKVTNKKDTVDTLEIAPDKTGYKISYKKGSQNIFDGSYTKTLKNTSTNRNTSYNVEFTVFANGQAYKVTIGADISEDVNPKDAKVIVKNSINRLYVPQEDVNSIMEKASQIGKLGLYLPDNLDKYFKRGKENIPDNCSVVTDCVANEVGTFDCVNSITNEVVNCATIPGN